MLLSSLLSLLLLFTSALSDECEPGFADTCFTSVEGDLHYMLDLKKCVTINVTQAAVHDLCLALEDSLNCTSDIIDSDCSNDEGRGSFDSWLRALRGALDHVCEGDHNRLRGILEGIPCWNIEDFFLCTFEYAHISHVQDLLDTPIDESECRKLQSVMSRCYQKSIVGSCREREDMSILVGDMIEAFFSSSACDQGDFSAVRSSSTPLIFVEVELLMIALLSLCLTRRME